MHWLCTVHAWLHILICICLVSAASYVTWWIVSRWIVHAAASPGSYVTWSTRKSVTGVPVNPCGPVCPHVASNLSINDMSETAAVVSKLSKQMTNQHPSITRINPNSFCVSFRTWSLCPGPYVPINNRQQPSLHDLALFADLCALGRTCRSWSYHGPSDDEEHASSLTDSSSSASAGVLGSCWLSGGGGSSGSGLAGGLHVLLASALTCATTSNLELSRLITYHSRAEVIWVRLVLYCPNSSSRSLKLIVLPWSSCLRIRWILPLQ